MNDEFRDHRYVYANAASGEPCATLCFYVDGRKEVGCFDFGKSPMTFTGDVDESGKLFVDYVLTNVLRKEKLAEHQQITIDTLTKRLRSALDSAQDHQKNAVRKEVQLCEAKNLLGKLITGWDKGGDDWYFALQVAKDFLAK